MDIHFENELDGKQEHVAGFMQHMEKEFNKFMQDSEEKQNIQNNEIRNYQEEF
jgi:hypothetical protein